MKTLYLHIGTAKTATSSIQKFLLLNQEALTRHGYCYPPVPHKYQDARLYRNGHFLVGKAFHDDGTKNRTLSVRYFHEGMAQLWDCFEKYDNVILSEETIWRHFDGSHKKLFPYLKKDAAEHHYQIKIIVYLRRQDEFQISNWNERVKHSKHRLTLTFEERLSQTSPEDARLLDYASRIDDIAEFFGKENVIVRRFQPDCWVNGSIIDDFMDCVGLAHTDDFLPLARDMNTGLYGNTAEIKRIINKNTAFTRTENAFFGDILRELSAETGEHYPCSMLSPEETREYLRQFEEGNAYVAQTYIGDGKPLFSDKIKQLPKWQPDNPYLSEDIIRFFSAVHVAGYRENKHFYAEFSELRDEFYKFRSEILEQQQGRRPLRERLKRPLHGIAGRLLHRERCEE